MFDADDDDLDFVPTAGSKLASVFQEKTKDNGNSSLVYTPPKKPKPTEQVIENQQNSATKSPAAGPKFSVIIADVVHSFKLEAGVFNDQRKVGVAVLGNAQIHAFQLLLYRTTSSGKQDYITVAKISEKFRYLVQPKFYCNYYDDAKNYWSLVFSCQDACMEFARQIGAARFRTIHGKAVVTQMIDPGDEGTSQGEITHLSISQQSFDINSITKYTPIEATIEISLNPKQSKWSEGLVSANPGSKWAIFIPASTTLPWAKVVSESPLVLEVVVEKKLQTNSIQAAEHVKEKTTSGSEEGSVQSLAESLSNKTSSFKTNLLSRVARLGQPTLPLKGAVYYNPSDSEDTEEEVSRVTSAASAAKPPLKPKFAKGRSAATPRTSSESEPTYTANPAAPAASAVWRPVILMNNGNKLIQCLSGDGQIVPMTSATQQYQLVTTASPVTSPSEPMTMFMSESRIQNAELRMNINRIVDKIDTLSTKVDTISNTCASRPSVSSATLDASTLLSNVEKLVRDNQTLTAEVAEKTEKLSELNERILSLVDNNSKLLEQNRVLLEEKQKTAETGDAQTVVVQKTKIEALENENSTLLKRIAELESRLDVLQDFSLDLNCSKTSELKAKDDELNAKHSELNAKDSELSDLRRSLRSVEAELETVVSERDKFRRLSQQDVNKRLKDAEDKVDSYKSVISELKDYITSLSANVNELESKIANMTTTHTEEKSAFGNQIKKYEETITELKTQIAEAERKNGSEVTQYTEDLLSKKNRSAVKTNVSADSDKAVSPAVKEHSIKPTVPGTSPAMVQTEGAGEAHLRNEFWRSEPPPVPKFEDEDNEDWLNM